MADIEYNVGTGGPISMAHSQSLVTFDPQAAAVRNFERASASAQVTVNAWTHRYDQTERGRIIGNVVI